jgi:hypothetical protein
MNRLAYYLSMVTLISNIFLLQSCSNLQKFSDCRKYKEAIAKAANAPLAKTPTPPKTKQEYIAGFRAIADMQEKMGEILAQIKLEDPKSQEFQKRSVATNQVFVEVFREQAQAIANLDKEKLDPKDIEAISRQFQVKRSEAHGNWMAVGDEWFKYCFP